VARLVNSQGVQKDIGILKAGTLAALRLDVEARNLDIFLPFEAGYFP